MLVSTGIEDSNSHGNFLNLQHCNDLSRALASCQDRRPLLRACGGLSIASFVVVEVVLHRVVEKPVDHLGPASEAVEHRVVDDI